MDAERRTNRSEVPQVALKLYLTSLAARSGLSAVALASDEGLLIAASQSDHDADAMAAICVARERRIVMRPEVVNSILRGEQLTSCPLNVHGEELYLTWLGARTPSVNEATAA